MLVDAAWLEQHGYSASLRNQYVASGWLEKPAHTLYRRPRGKLDWQQVVASLQMMMKKPFVVGGRSALELQGYAHYLSQSQLVIHLYGPKKPPAWLNELGIDTHFVTHNSERLFALTGKTTPSANEVTALSWGQWNWSIAISTPERAVLELLDELPARESFHQVDKLFEGLTSLSPRRLQPLLQICGSVKVKRLFFFFADRHQHAWRKRLDKSVIDFGSGNRKLVSGGKLDPVYHITVPEDLDGVQ